MNHGKVLLGTVLGVVTVSALGLTLLGTDTGSPCCGSSKATVEQTTAAKTAASCPASKVATATVSPSPAGGTSDAPACCGSCDKTASCPASKVATATVSPSPAGGTSDAPACCAKAGTTQSSAAVKAKTAKAKSLPTLQQVHVQQLPSALKSINAALKALEKGDQTAAVRYLTAARLNIQTAQVALAQHVHPTYVNAVCPIMGSPIHPDKVTASLTREYKGQKVAFCCAGCPKAWDKLTDAQKEEKLAKAETKPSPLLGLKQKP